MAVMNMDTYTTHESKQNVLQFFFSLFSSLSYLWRIGSRIRCVIKISKSENGNKQKEERKRNG